MRILVEIEDEKDANLVISLAKRLKGKILEDGKAPLKLKKGKTINKGTPLANAKNSGISLIPDQDDREKNQTQYWEL